MKNREKETPEPGNSRTKKTDHREAEFEHICSLFRSAGDLKQKYPEFTKNQIIDRIRAISEDSFNMAVSNETLCFIVELALSSKLKGVTL